MTLSRLDKFPAPYFGGKGDAAPIVWAALGDPAHYVDPFCGSIVTLLRRPALANRAYYSETVNDLDGLLVNAIRSIQMKPQETAEAASWPVTEADLTARHLAIVRWAAERELERLMADPAYCDPLIGGWWLWGMSGWIGSGWCAGNGPWVVGDDGRITKLTGAGGVTRKLPHMGDDGRSVNSQTAREPGVTRQLPHMNNHGQGVNHAGAREPGVTRQLPHMGDNGKGLNNAAVRANGVAGMPDVPALADYRAAVEADYAETGGYHPMTMPEVRRWFAWLSARLRHVRVLNGDWKRAVTGSVLKTINVRMGDDVVGVFLDPPYADTAGRADGLYAKDSLTVSHAAREWAIANGNDPKIRIVFAGYADEHGTTFADAGWREVEWFKGGFLKGGMANQNSNGHQQHRERLWLSPHCLAVAEQADEPAETQLELLL